jgi:hypothetical protein
MSNPHNLVPREQTYSYERKLITIHSCDRDISKYPNGAQFQITLPQTISNIESVCLSDVSFPVNQFNISEALSNNVFCFSLEWVDGNDKISTTLRQFTIPNGYYANDDLATQLQNQMTVCMEGAAANGKQSSHQFNVTYDQVGQSFVFAMTAHEPDDHLWVFQNNHKKTKSFTIHVLPSISAPAISYPFSPPPIQNQTCDWGLGYNLGFNKSDIGWKSEAVASDDDSVNLYYNGGYVNKTKNGTNIISKSESTKLTTTHHVLRAQNSPILLANTVMYMELDGMNQIDELSPYPDEINQLGNGGGRTNSVFAKIPITTSPQSQAFDSRNGFLSATTHYNPVLEKVVKLKIKFRYHNGSLVDFRNAPFHFTLEFKSVRNEIGRNMTFRN